MSLSFVCPNLSITARVALVDAGTGELQERATPPLRSAWWTNVWAIGTVLAPTGGANYQHHFHIIQTAGPVSRRPDQSYRSYRRSPSRKRLRAQAAMTTCDSGCGKQQPTTTYKYRKRGRVNVPLLKYLKDHGLDKTAGGERTHEVKKNDRNRDPRGPAVYLFGLGTDSQKE
jgi:hypothetical protein